MAQSHQSIEQIFREEHGQVLAALISKLRDIDLAEDVLQEAYLVALEQWPVAGLPRKPGAWLTTTARNKAIDRWRRQKSWEQKGEGLRAAAAFLVPVPTMAQRLVRAKRKIKKAGIPLSRPSHALALRTVRGSFDHPLPDL